MNAGSFQLSGVAIRNNKGRGVWTPNANAKDFLVSGCKVFSNGQGMDLSGAGPGYLVSSNIFSNNRNASNFGGKAGGALVSGNVGEGQ